MSYRRHDLEQGLPFGVSVYSSEPPKYARLRINPKDIPIDGEKLDELSDALGLHERQRGIKEFLDEWGLNEGTDFGIDGQDWLRGGVRGAFGDPSSRLSFGSQQDDDPIPSQTGTDSGTVIDEGGVVTLFARGQEWERWTQDADGNYVLLWSAGNHTPKTDPTGKPYSPPGKSSASASSTGSTSTANRQSEMVRTTTSQGGSGGGKGQNTVTKEDLQRLMGGKKTPNPLAESAGRPAPYDAVAWRRLRGLEPPSHATDSSEDAQNGGRRGPAPRIDWQFVVGGGYTDPGYEGERAYGPHHPNQRRPLRVRRPSSDDPSGFGPGTINLAFTAMARGPGRG